MIVCWLALQATMAPARTSAAPRPMRRASIPADSSTAAPMKTAAPHVMPMKVLPPRRSAPRFNRKISVWIGVTKSTYGLSPCPIRALPAMTRP